MPKWIKILLVFWPLVIATFICWLIFVYTPNFHFIYLIDGNSMYPTLEDKELTNVYPNTKPKPGDIIVFRINDQYCDKTGQNEVFVKRLIKIDEKGNYWVEGDNKTNSCDSRTFGWITLSQRSFIGVIK